MLNPQALDIAERLIREQLRQREEFLDYEIANIREQNSANGVLFSTGTVRRITDLCRQPSTNDNRG